MWQSNGLFPPLVSSRLPWEKATVSRACNTKTASSHEMKTQDAVQNPKVIQSCLTRGLDAWILICYITSLNLRTFAASHQDRAEGTWFKSTWTWCPQTSCQSCRSFLPLDSFHSFDSFVSCFNPTKHCHQSTCLSLQLRNFQRIWRQSSWVPLQNCTDQESYSPLHGLTWQAGAISTVKPGQKIQHGGWDHQQTTSWLYNTL